MLFDFMAEEKISVIFWVPTVMISVANSGVLEEKKLDALKLILFAGEVMPIGQLNRWMAAYPNCTFVNMYGPTESTDIALYYIVDRKYRAGETLPIGIPCANMKAIILNGKNELKKGRAGRALHRRYGHFNRLLELARNHGGGFCAEPVK